MISREVLGFALCVGLIGTSIGCTRVQQGAAAGGLAGAGLGVLWNVHYGNPTQHAQAALIGGSAGAAVGALAGDAWREADEGDYRRDRVNYEADRRVGAPTTYRTEERRIYERDMAPGTRTDARWDDRRDTGIGAGVGAGVGADRRGVGVEGGARIGEQDRRSGQDIRREDTRTYQQRDRDGRVGIEADAELEVDRGVGIEGGARIGETEPRR